MHRPAVADDTGRCRQPGRELSRIADVAAVVSDQAAVRAADTRTHQQLEGLIAAGVEAGEWPPGTDPALAARLFTAGLYVLLNRLTGHVKYLPIFFALMLLYALGKQFHLSPLVLVLAFGLLLNNTFLIDGLKWLKQHHSESFEDDLAHFKQIVMEGAFFVRTFFFLLLGFSTDLADFGSLSAWAVTGAVLASIYLTRWPLLRVLCRADVHPLLWVAPRGLITVVLYLSLPDDLRVERFPEGAVMLVVLLTAFVLSTGIRASAGSRDAARQGVAEP